MSGRSTTAPLLAFLALSCTVAQRSPPTAPPAPRVATGAGFIENAGQLDPAARFVHRETDSRLFLTDDRLVFVVPQQEDGKSRLRAVRVRLPASGPPAGLETLPGKVIYVGSDAKPIEAASHASVRYPLRGGITFDVGTWDGRLGYRATVPANTPLSALRLEFQDVDALRPWPGGALEARWAGGRIRLGAPKFFQSGPSGTTVLTGRYAVSGNTVGFQVEGRDPDLPLVIDPEIDVQALIAGSEGDSVEDIAIFSDGTIYLVGTTASVSFPPEGTTVFAGGEGSGNALVSRLTPDGAGGLQAMWTVIIGGESHDRARAVDLGSDGTAYVAGSTQAGSGAEPFPSFNITGSVPTPAPGLANAFLLRVQADGTVLSSVLLGGSGTEEGRGVAVDPDGARVAVVGWSTSSSFAGVAAPVSPFVGMNSDAFLAVLDLESTAIQALHYIGGSRNDVAAAVAFHDGVAYVAGSTSSSDFPGLGENCLNQSTPPDCLQLYPLGAPNDAFLIRVTPGSPTFSGTTIAGGNWDDQAFGVAVAEDGSAYVSGYTWLHGYLAEPLPFPTTPGAVDTGPVANGRDAFVARMWPTLDASTLIAGPAWDEAFDVAIGADGSVLVAGSTESGAEMLPVAPVPAGFATGASDGFFARLTPDLSSAEWWLLGGGADDAALAVAARGTGACTGGYTRSDDFVPLGNPAAIAGTQDGFVVCLDWSMEAPQIVLTVEDTPDPLDVGDAVVYTATLTNVGGAAANDVQLTGSFEPKAILMAEPSDAGCTLGSDLISCALGALPAGAERILDFSGTAYLPGTAQQNFTASWLEGAQPLQVPEATDVGVPSTQLTLTLTTPLDPVPAPEPAYVEIVATNTGTAVAHDTQIELRITSGIATFVSAGLVGAPLSCATFTQRAICSVGPIAAGASASMVVALTPQTPVGLQASATSFSATVSPVMGFVAVQ